jgi:hypothetical protein
VTGEWLHAVSAGAGTLLCVACLTTPGVGGGGPDDGGTGDSGAADSGLSALEIVDVARAPFAGTQASGLATDGTLLWLFRREFGGQLRVSSGDLGEWDLLAAASSIEVANPPGTTGPGPLNGGAIAYVDTSKKTLVVARWRDPTVEVDEQDRAAVYSIQDDQWTVLDIEESVYLDTGFATAGEQVFGVQHAGGASSLRRLDLAAPLEDGTTLIGISDDTPDWFSRVAKVAVVGDSIYLLKNDWPEDELDEGDPDLLLKVAIADFVPGGETPIAAQRDLPFQVGAGSALVAVPPGWAGVRGGGGLLVIAGESPSNREGAGDNSTRLALFDIAEDEWILQDSSLPFPVGQGTSAVFYSGQVVVLASGEDAPRILTIQPR